MTEEQFLALHSTRRGSNINTAYTINVNYDDTGVLVPGSVRGQRTATPDYIIGITVTRKAKFVDDEQGADLNGILQGVEKVRFSFDGYDYALRIISRAYYDGTTVSGVREQTSFFYFRVTPFELPAGASQALIDPQVERNVVIDFSPFIEDLEFAFANYNATLNNAQQSRRSFSIVVSDRQQDTSVPSNFTALYEGTAEFAEVQDSLYTDTGWTNARYNGSKTTAATFSGVTPSLVGSTFRGEVFSGNTTYDTYCLLRNDSRLFEPLFHTGPREEPDYLTGSMGIYLPTLLPPAVTTLNYISGSQITGSIDEGDILILNNEKLKVRSVNQLVDPPVVKVIRGWAGTTKASHIAGTEFYKIDRTDIFRFSGLRTKASLLDNNIIYTETANVALHTDSYGTVFSQSLCPQTLLLGIDDDNPIP